MEPAIRQTQTSTRTIETPKRVLSPSEIFQSQSQVQAQSQKCMGSVMSAPPAVKSVATPAPAISTPVSMPTMPPMPLPPSKSTSSTPITNAQNAKACQSIQTGLKPPASDSKTQMFTVMQHFKAGQDLIRSGARPPGPNNLITAKDYLEAANNLKDHQAQNPQITTLMLQLYEAAAKKHIELGKKAEIEAKFAENKGSMDTAGDFYKIANNNFKLAYKIRADAANFIKFSPEHKLSNMEQSIQEGVKKQTNENIGAHFTSMGPSGLVDGAVVLRTRTVVETNEKNKEVASEKHVLNFQISDHARKDVGKTVDRFIKPNPENSDLRFTGEANFETNIQNFQNDLQSKGINVTVTQTDNQTFLGVNEKGKFTAKEGISLVNTHSLEFEFKNIGKVTVGINPENELTYHNVTVEISAEKKKKGTEGESLKVMQQMLTSIGLGPILGEQMPDDNQRLKLALIFKTNFPQLADKLEKQDNFYQLSPTDLKAEMRKLMNDPAAGISDQAKARFENHLESDLVKKVEVIPGKEVYANGELSQELEKAGAIGLMSGVGSCIAIVSTLNSGSLSTEQRLLSSINVKGGASYERDSETGASRATMKRMVTQDLLAVPIPEKEINVVGEKEKKHFVNETKLKNPVEEGKSTAVELSKWEFSGIGSICWGTELVNTGATCYNRDQYMITNEHYMAGAKKIGVYNDRQDPLSFVENLGKTEDRSRLQYNDALKDQPLRVGQFRHDKDGLQRDGAGNLKPDARQGANNEVGISGGFSNPRHIKSVLMRTPEAKQELIRELNNSKMIQDKVKNKNGEIIDGTITYGNGKYQARLNDFIQVGNKFEEKHWKTEIKTTGPSRK